MRSLCLAAALTFVSTSSVLAAGADLLADALAQVPETALNNQDPIPFYFLNMQALQNIAETAGKDTGFARMRTEFGMIAAAEPLIRGDLKTWQDNAGISLSDVRYFAGMGQSPDRLSLWGLGLAL